MEWTDDGFLEAWGAGESAKPSLQSSPSSAADPWGTVFVVEGSEIVPIQGNLQGTSVNSEQQLPQPLSRDVCSSVDEVFQQCNNFTESAIPHKNNNSNANDDRKSGFDDDFGAWSETDVLFKSGLLDQEFKTVSVTAEEDDLWSSADLSSLNLSVEQSQKIVAEDDDIGQRPEEEQAVSDRSEAFHNPDVIVSSETANDGDNDGDNEDGGNVPLSSTLKSSTKTNLSQDHVQQTGSRPDSFGGTDDDNVRLTTSAHNGEKDGVNLAKGSSYRVTHSNAKSTTTAGTPKTVNTREFRVIHSSSSMPGSTVKTQTVNTSINSTQNVDTVSNSDTNLSINPQSRILPHGGTSGEDCTGNVISEAHSQEGIPSIIVDSFSGPFLTLKKDNTNMGNVLDSDKEENKKMEGEGVVTQDKGKHPLPPETSEVNGETIAPAIDPKEAAKSHDEGTEAMLNGDSDSMNVSLDTQTQTREEEFPPDAEYQAKLMTTGEDRSKADGLVDGQVVEETSQDLKQKPEEETEKEENAEGAVDDNQEKEDSSEGYGSQDADKALASEENGAKDHMKENGGEEEKEPEVAQDEGLASPEREESKVTFSNEETGLRSVVASETEYQSSGGQSYVQSAVKMREKSGSSRVNSHVVKQNRISFVEQEVLRNKQQEEDFRRERERRSQELTVHSQSSSPSSLSPPGSAGNSRLQSPTSPEPPPMKPVKAPIKQTNSKARAVYQELNYNPKAGGGNRSNVMVKEWESKFKK